MEAPAADPRAKFAVRAALCGLAVGLLGGVAYVLATVPPTDHPYYPKCSFHQTTGLHCPGCGLTRCGHALLNGDLRQAVAYNLLGIAFLPWLGVLILRTLWRWLWQSPPAVRRPRRGRVNWSYAVMVALFAFWVVRNVPLYPFTLLAPHEVAP